MPDAACGILDFQDAPAVIHGRRADQVPGPEGGAVGASAADIEVGHGGVVLQGIVCRTCTLACDQALDIRSSHADHKLTRQPG